jgi:hypothetical protein
MDITKLLTININPITKDTNRKWEEFIGYMKDKFSYDEVELNIGYVNSDSFDFYSILYGLNIPERFHYPIMRLNGLKASTDFSIKNTRLKIYNARDLDQLYNSVIIK